MMSLEGGVMGAPLVGVGATRLAASITTTGPTAGTGAAAAWTDSATHNSRRWVSVFFARGVRGGSHAVPPPSCRTRLSSAPVSQHAACRPVLSPCCHSSFCCLSCCCCYYCLSSPPQTNCPPTVVHLFGISHTSHSQPTRTLRVHIHRLAGLQLWSVTKYAAGRGADRQQLQRLGMAAWLSDGNTSTTTHTGQVRRRCCRCGALSLCRAVCHALLCPVLVFCQLSRQFPQPCALTCSGCTHHNSELHTPPPLDPTLPPGPAYE